MVTVRYPRPIARLSGCPGGNCRLGAERRHIPRWHRHLQDLAAKQQWAGIVCPIVYSGPCDGSSRTVVGETLWAATQVTFPLVPFVLFITH